MDKRLLFDEAYADCFSRVYAYFSLCFGEQAAEELAQQTFIKVWHRMQMLAFNPPDNWRAWVFRIAVNVKNDYLRQQYRRPFPDPLPQDYPAAGEMEEETLKKLCVEEAFSRISLQEKEMLLLYAGGLSSRELGEILGISASAARSRLAAARKHLETEWKLCGGDEN